MQTKVFPNDEEDLLEFERNLTLPYIKALFPMFEFFTNTQRTPEIHFEVT
jgi:hypothetical protein